MFKFALAFLGGLTMAMAPIAQTLVEHPDFVRRDTFDSPETGRVDFVGVCSIMPDMVVCWDRSGARDSKLDEMVLYHLEKGANLVEFSFGKKNRYVIFKTGISKPSLTMHASFMRSKLTPNPKQFWIRHIAVAPDQKQATHDISYRVPIEGSPFKVAFRKGEGVKAPGFAVQLKGFQGNESKPNHPFGGGPVSAGTFIEFGPIQTDLKESALVVRPLDVKGRPILYVDRQGKMISERDYAKGDGAQYNAMHAIPNPLPSNVRCTYEGQSTSESWRRWINVAPESIGYLELTITYKKIVRFVGIPLDSK